MILSFGACSSSKQSTDEPEKTDPDQPITLNPENIEQYIKIDTEVTRELGFLANGYYNSYLMELSSVSTRYHFDDTTIDITVYTTNSDFNGKSDYALYTVDNKDCWVVDRATIEFNGENPTKNLTFESSFSDGKAYTTDYFYVIESVSGMVSVLRN